ncbi:mitochondrial ribosomal protein L47 [Lasioglossum baleicum]|uniref:mitochondrial ribosomal protein L47 n=1 Tax=Lasioglossum baleicum TaxID=434251 RepID=UPI003FCD567D
MAALTKAIHISKSVNNVRKLFANLSCNSVSNSIAPAIHIRRIPTFQYTFIHTTSKKNDLMEFFDDEKNWGKPKIQVGRSWKKDELRLKSNEDLHKLWFVLLKERNMLLTMEAAYKVKYEYFPNPERIDKVEESMSNLESVVRERNKAYHLLETGESGERPGKLVYNPIGLRYYYRLRQYPMPKFANRKWNETHKFGYQGFAVQKFLRLYREKIWNQKRKLRNLHTRRVAVLMRMFPNLDVEAAKEEYPLANIEKAKNASRSNGHYAPK